MRPLLNCISTVAILASIATAASGEELQWIHSSQQKSRSKATSAPKSVAKPSPTRKVEVQRLAAKKPTFRQPQQFKQPQRVRGVEVGPQPIAPPTHLAPVDRTPKQPTHMAAAAPVGRPSHARTSSAAADLAYRNRRSQSPRGVFPVQHEEIPTPVEGETIHPYETPYAGDGSMYAGEVGCGFPEPTCGCAGQCNCNDDCIFGEPGCGAWGQEFMGCGSGYGGECCGDDCGCGDGCCGDACCEPTCGCGGAGCDGYQPWPQSLFGCDQRGCVPVLWAPPLKEFVAFAGVQGFKNPLDGSRDSGNFGFHEGFNVSGKMAWLPWPGLGYQFGYMATQNQLSGDSGTMTNGSHSQHFVTWGLFRRKRQGVQYGVVWDVLRDERQGAKDFGQMRGEISYINCFGRELGFGYMANTNSNLIGNINYHAVDQYRVFYRINGRRGGECRVFAGFTGQNDAIIGSDFQTPLTNSWSLEGDWAYLIPDGGNNGSAARQEAWNLSMQVVWHFGCRAKSWNNRPYRPLFDVANNGSLIVVD